jgi:hypothetical protein
MLVQRLQRLAAQPCVVDLASERPVGSGLDPQSLAKAELSGPGIPRSQ